MYYLDHSKSMHYNSVQKDFAQATIYNVDIPKPFERSMKKKFEFPQLQRYVGHLPSKSTLGSPVITRKQSKYYTDK